jgi:hypothetical protein
LTSSRLVSVNEWTHGFRFCWKEEVLDRHFPDALRRFTETCEYEMSVANLDDRVGRESGR